MSVVGESMPYSDFITGMQFGSRKNNGSIKFTIWTKDANNQESNIAIGKYFKEILQIQKELWYSPHKLIENKYTILYTV
jgi:hypothetical protein